MHKLHENEIMVIAKLYKESFFLEHVNTNKIAFQ